MRILNVTAQKPHSTGSGVYLTETVKEFQALGHDTAVVAGICGDDTVSFPDGVAFYPVYYQTPALPFPICGMSDEMPYESTVYRTMTEEMTAQFESAFGDVLHRAVAEFKPDVILCHHLYLLCALIRRLFAQIPLWGMCHGTDLRQMNTNPLRREEIRAAVSSIDKAFCLHDEQRRQVMDCFGIDRDRTAVVGVGYNSRIFYDRGIRTPHDDVQLIYAGKISEKKGVCSLISALDKLEWRREAFSLRLAGGWNNEEQLEKVKRQIAACGWDVTLLGPLPQERLAEEYSAADVFVLPSFFEGLPLVLAEAMSCGARVVCTDLPGIRQWMDGMAPGNGICFVPPPPMQNVDTPVPGSLPAFETALAQAIRATAAAAGEKRDVTALSWASVAKRILGG